MIPRNQSAHDDQDHQKNYDGSNDHSGTPKSDPRPRWGNSMRRGFVAGSDLAHRIMSAVHIGSAIWSRLSSQLFPNPFIWTCEDDH